jgi:hypothetical protein
LNPLVQLLRSLALPLLRVLPQSFDFCSPGACPLFNASYSLFLFLFVHVSRLHTLTHSPTHCSHFMHWLHLLPHVYAVATRTTSLL